MQSKHFCFARTYLLINVYTTLLNYMILRYKTQYTIAVRFKYTFAVQRTRPYNFRRTYLYSIMVGFHIPIIIAD